MTTALTVAIAVILLTSNFTLINAQQQAQQLTAQPRVVENGATTAATTFQSTNDSFRVHVPDGWLIQDVNNSGSALLEEWEEGLWNTSTTLPRERTATTSPSHC
jgi:hypothetical protein